MRRLILPVSLCALIAVVEVWAEDPGDVTDKSKHEAGNAPAAGAADNVTDWYITYLDKAIGLTGEQKNSMDGIIRARNKSMWEFQVQNANRLKAAGNALVAAYRSMDGDGIAKAQRDYQELHAPLHQLMRQSQNNLMQVLTLEQKARLHEFQVMKAIEAMTAPVQLSEDQIRRIKAAWPKAGDHKTIVTMGHEAVQQVLTVDQKIAVAKHHGLAFVKTAFRHAELTGEQLKQAEVILEQWATDPSVKPEDFHRTLTAKIEELLTPEQREAM